jgi:hypothetical protein
MRLFAVPRPKNLHELSYTKCPLKKLHELSCTKCPLKKPARTVLHELSLKKSARTVLHELSSARSVVLPLRKSHFSKMRKSQLAKCENRIFRILRIAFRIAKTKTLPLTPYYRTQFAAHK